MKKKYPTSIRISSDAKRLLARLADKLGISQGAVMELAIRRLADAEEKQ